MKRIKFKMLEYQYKDEIRYSKPENGYQFYYYNQPWVAHKKYQWWYVSHYPTGMAANHSVIYGKTRSDALAKFKEFLKGFTPDIIANLVKDYTTINPEMKK